MFRISTLISLLIFLTNILTAQTVSVLPSIKDNSMFSESGSESLGIGKIFTGQNCQGNNRRALIEFDLTTIPADAVVTSVILSLGAENSGANGDGVIEIFGVTKEWGEGFSSTGSGNGGQAFAPDATWTDAMFGTVTWDTPGGDFDPSLLTSRITSENNQTISFSSSTNFVTQAQTWINDPSSNHGIIVIGVESQTCAAYRFGSKDIGSAPQLEVTWESADCEPSEWVIDATICEDDDFTLNGIVYDQSNPSGTQEFTTVDGCDSTIIVNLDFISNSVFLIEETFCDNDGSFFNVNGTIYDINNPSGIEVLTSSSGCDSTVTINLNYLPTASGMERYFGCAGDGYSVVVNGTVYDELQSSGSEVLLGAAHNGCDSIVDVNLMYQETVPVNITHTGCEGNGFSVVVDDVIYDENNPSGMVLLTSSFGCDSIVNIDLVFAPGPNSGTASMTSGVCNENDAILDLNTLLTGADAGGVWTETSPTPSTGLLGNQFDGSGQNPGTYFFRYTVSAINCPDEFTQVMVNVQTPITATVTTSGSVCNTNDGVNSSTFNFNALITDGFADGIWLDSDGAGVNLTDFSSVDFSEVQGGSWTFTYLTSVVGNCPEERYPVTILVENCICPAVMTNEDYNGCSGDNFEVTVNGTLYNEANPSGTETLVSTVTGCDSIVNINLVFNPSATGEATFSTCDLSAPATTTEVITNGAFNGCDSIVTFTTIYLENDETNISLTSCDPDDEGVITEMLTNQNGCDSIVTTTTTILASDMTNVFEASCNPADTGTVEIILTNQNGCDSIVTITTTILASDMTNVFEASCNPADTGTVEIILTNQNGCDSVVTIVTELEDLDNSITVSDATVVATIFGATYQWLDCDNNNAPIAGATDRFFMATETGNYAVEIMENGCMVTSECVMVTVVNTEEIWFADQIEVLPNPTSGAIQLTFGELENVNIRVMGVTGKILLERTNLTGGTADLFLEGPSGLYFVGVEVAGVWGWMKVVKGQ